MVKQLTPSSSHSAGGPFGGYMYQLEFALLLLFDLQPGECLGIETIDDVGKESEEGQTRYQLKNQASSLSERTEWQSWKFRDQQAYRSEHWQGHWNGPALRRSKESQRRWPNGLEKGHCCLLRTG